MWCVVDACAGLGVDLHAVAAVPRNLIVDHPQVADVVAHRDAVNVLVVRGAQVAVVVDGVVPENDVFDDAWAGVDLAVRHLPVDDADPAARRQTMDVAVPDHDMARGQQDHHRTGVGLVRQRPELDVLDDQVVAADFPESACERPVRRAHAADIDRIGRRAVRDDGRRAVVRGVVRAVQFDDRSGRQRNRNRPARLCRSSVCVAGVGRRGLRRIDVVEAGRADGPRIGRCGRDVGDAE